MNINQDMGPAIVRLVRAYREWARAGKAGDDMGSADAIAELKTILDDLYWAMPRLCPYCGAQMSIAQAEPDQAGYSVTTYACRCGACMTLSCIPPEE